jgi:hypothetical protein
VFPSILEIVFQKVVFIVLVLRVYLSTVLRTFKQKFSSHISLQDGQFILLAVLIHSHDLLEFSGRFPFPCR